MDNMSLTITEGISNISQIFICCPVLWTREKIFFDSAWDIWNTIPELYYFTLYQNMDKNMF